MSLITRIAVFNKQLTFLGAFFPFQLLSRPVNNKKCYRNDSISSQFLSSCFILAWWYILIIKLFCFWLLVVYYLPVTTNCLLITSYRLSKNFLSQMFLKWILNGDPELWKDHQKFSIFFSIHIDKYKMKIQKQPDCSPIKFKYLPPFMTKFAALE